MNNMDLLINEINNGGNTGVINQSVDFYQGDFSDFNGKVIFSEAVFREIAGNLKSTRLEGIEKGKFLYGHKFGEDLFLFDGVSKIEFESGPTYFELTEESLLELEMLSRGGCDAVICFHTHPDVYQRNHRNLSFEDLRMFGLLQKVLGENVCFGGLGTFNGSSSEVSLVNFDKEANKFKKVKDLYFVMGGDLNKITAVDGVPTISLDTVYTVSSDERRNISNQLLKK